LFVLGGNPLACVVAESAVRVLLDENLADNAQRMGVIFREEMMKLKESTGDIISAVRGRGLMNAVQISSVPGRTAMDVCMGLRDAAPLGVLAKPTHANIIRFAPPLNITEPQLRTGIEIISKVVKKCANK
jgi:ornithine--oxo-acid transaminase